MWGAGGARALCVLYIGIRIYKAHVGVCTGRGLYEGGYGRRVRGGVVSRGVQGVRERVDHEKQKTYGVCHEVCGREGCLQVSTLQQGVGEACHAGV